MKSRAIATLGLSALILAGAGLGVMAGQGGIALAGTMSPAKLARMAAIEGKKAQNALAAGTMNAAIGFAENAVRYSPQDAQYRALLGQAYMKAGRFASARDAFTDSLALSADDGAVALGLALAQTATGDWASARRTLEEHSALIPVADRGLTLALAGDPATAVELLTTAARSPEANAKTRQNLALSLALAGRWPEAKAVAALDIAPGDLDKRIVEWAEFAYPKTASQQVATLLGVVAVQDDGQPVALALNAPATPQAMASVDAYMPGQLGEAPAAPAVVAAAELPAAMPIAVESAVPAAVPSAAVTIEAPAASMAPDAKPTIIFAERREIVQPVPASQIQPASAAKVRVARVAVSPAPIVRAANAVAKGNFFVQLGAYENADIAHNGWRRAMERLPALADHTPSGMSVKTTAGVFYRLSVGGFARSDALSICSAYRAHGGICFVRTGAGDQIAQWASAPRQLASR